MFILKRQDVELSSIQHPKRDQKIPILKYQDQTFRLIRVFSAEQADEAISFWKDLTDNQGKFCVLLQESDRHSVWGRVQLDQLLAEGATLEVVPDSYAQACLLILQAVYFDIEELLGTRQAKLFQKDLAGALDGRQLPQANSEKAIAALLECDPLNTNQLPRWESQHLVFVLQAVHGLGKAYFGNTNFAQEVEDILQDLPEGECEQFLTWLKQSPIGKDWG
ncbi:Npun_F0813 family protein [Spirulina subsalsa]|uniref:Npun_F0813 family protein n=1 Tax=Spirulina subsalsa TaxID=54311 RepID=UPI000313FDCD|nr:Npun_F0813 family protein [Spirulina subsalsa]